MIFQLVIFHEAKIREEGGRPILSTALFDHCMVTRALAVQLNAHMMENIRERLVPAFSIFELAADEKALNPNF